MAQVAACVYTPPFSRRPGGVACNVADLGVRSIESGCEQQGAGFRDELFLDGSYAQRGTLRRGDIVEYRPGLSI